MAVVEIGGVTVEPGQRRRIELPVARLSTLNQMAMPVEVVNGLADGPRLWLSAAIHGDEINGVEIIHRVLGRISPRTLKGEVIAVPIVNVFGFVYLSRLLPDGRDLNRSFPGSLRGSLASRMAHMFMTEIVGRSTHGIDLHTAGGHRVNLPQVRANLLDPETRRCAEAFGAPIMIHGEAPRGSLRQAVAQRGVPVIVYEAGEPHRFNREAIELGVRGIERVMAELGMIDRDRKAATGQKTARRADGAADHPPMGSRAVRSTPQPAGRSAPVRSATTPPRSMEARVRTWVRARNAGLLRLHVRLGRWVREGQKLGVIRDVFGQQQSLQTAPCDGLIIGHTNHPLVSQGDAIVHIARDVIVH